MSTKPRSRGWLVVHVETGAMDGCYLRREAACESARWLQEDHGGTWLVAEIAALHGPADVSIPSDRMFHMNYFDDAPFTARRDPAERAAPRD